MAIETERIRPGERGLPRNAPRRDQKRDPAPFPDLPEGAKGEEQEPGARDPEPEEPPTEGDPERRIDVIV
jgi:hypothetical protein